MSDVSTSHLYPPGNITGTHFCYRSGSSVGIVTDYGLDGPGSNASEDEIFRHPDQPWGTPASCKMGTGPFLGIKCGRGVLLTTHPLLVARSWKSRAIPLPTLLSHTGPVTGKLYLYLTNSCYRLNQLQGYSTPGRIMSMKNSNDTIGNRTHDLPACRAVPQSTAKPVKPLKRF